MSKVIADCQLPIALWGFLLGGDSLTQIGLAVHNKLAIGNRKSEMP
jgi:hypothetical protein